MSELRRTRRRLLTVAVAGTFGIIAGCSDTDDDPDDGGNGPGYGG